ncbi:hypothetical protein B566_EDAN001347 [Ephemera danica]|nr:hypothetical protein B566_EDAN001347 [Ephemera danica]
MNTFTALALALMAAVCVSAAPGGLATSYANSYLGSAAGYGYGGYGLVHGLGATSYANQHQISLASPTPALALALMAAVCVSAAPGGLATSYANSYLGSAAGYGYGGYGLVHGLGATSYANQHQISLVSPAPVYHGLYAGHGGLYGATSYANGNLYAIDAHHDLHHGYY